ncbi:MAG TPA: hypothetical protein VF671_25380 [Pseudomonas sp.]|jgi:hypothetical protein
MRTPGLAVDIVEKEKTYEISAEEPEVTLPKNAEAMKSEKIVNVLAE